MMGVEQMEIVVVEYDERWPELFARESTLLKNIIGDNLLDIQHIGSTSVPGLLAKPIIDILLVVHDLEKLDSCNKELAQLAYEAMGEFGIKGRRYFRKGAKKRSHQIHAFQEGSPHIARHLAFRDYLRFFPLEAKKYGEVKRILAKRFPHNPEGYMDGKDNFIKEREKLALDWQK